MVGPVIGNRVAPYHGKRGFESRPVHLNKIYMEGDTMPRSQTESSVGSNLVICPVGKCTYVHRFVETAATISDPKGARETREKYLRLSHIAGRHNSR